MPDFNRVKPFRFWCQKVLPLVYDDSLSYYELLNKVVDYLNNTIEDVNSVIQLTEDFTEEQAAAYAEFTAGINQTVEELTSAFNTLHDFVDGYFENLDVQEEIDNKLDEMATDGTLSAMVIPVATTMIPGLITQWLNEHITPTSPPVDKTLTISNAAADSKVVGTNFEDLKQRMSLEEEWEIPITHEDLIQGGYNSDGSLNQDGTNYLRTPQMIPIYPGMSMHFKGGAVIDRMKAGYFDPVTRRLDTSKDIPWFTGERTVTFDMYGLIIPLFRRAANTEVVPTDFDAEFELISETKTRIETRVLYKNGGQTVSGDIGSGTGLECDYNNQARKNLVISFSGKIPIGSTFTNLEIGLKSGSTKYNKIVIDTQNATFTTMPDTVVTKPHGLTIAKNIQVTIKTILENKAIVRITSNGNFVDLEFTPYQQWRIASAYAETSGSLTVCTLSCVNQDIAKPVWFFGDSYTAYASNRWPFYADKWVNNILLDGYGGETSNYAITAFETYLGSGYPQYAVLATGMNDGSDTDVNTPNADWLSAVEEFIEICEDNQIIPVLCTVPTTPVYNNNGKNVYVRTSGYKYIDFAKAVGADGTGAWYAGMLGTDNIHPTVSGAKALCAQIEADFAEVFIQGVETDKSLTRFGVAADAGASGERFDTVDGEISELREDLQSNFDMIVNDVIGRYEYLEGITVTPNRYIDSSGNEASNTGSRVSNFIPITNGTYYLTYTKSASTGTLRVYGYKNESPVRALVTKTNATTEPTVAPFTIANDEIDSIRLSWFTTIDLLSLSDRQKTVEGEIDDLQAQITEANSNITNIETELEIIQNVKTLVSPTWSSGGITPGSGAINGIATQVHSNVIYTQDGAKVVCTNNTDYVCRVAVYTGESTSTWERTISAAQSVTVEAGKYIRVYGNKRDNTQYDVPYDVGQYFEVTTQKQRFNEYDETSRFDHSPYKCYSSEFTDWYKCLATDAEITSYAFSRNKSYVDTIALYDTLVDNEYVTKNLLRTISITGMGTISVYEYVFRPIIYTGAPLTAAGSSLYRATPKILMDGSMHGFEKGSTFGNFLFLYDLVHNWQSNKTLEHIRNNCEIRCIAISNPYGFENNTYSNENDVNINRNFPASTWKYEEPGAQGSGDAPGDQPETQMLMNWVNANSDALIYLCVHTNGQYYTAAYLEMNACLYPSADYGDAYTHRIFNAIDKHIETQSMIWPEQYSELQSGIRMGQYQSTSGGTKGGTVDIWALENATVNAMTIEGINGLRVSDVVILELFSGNAMRINAEIVGNFIAQLLQEYGL